MKIEKRPGVAVAFETTENLNVVQTFTADYARIAEKFDLSNKPRRPNRCQPAEGPVINRETLELSIEQMNEGLTVDWETVKDDLSL